MFNGSFPTFVALLFSLATACTPEIGDECTSASECVSTETDRLCLTEQIENFPGGYCTVFNCAPDSCPEEAVCVGYRTNLANSEQCSDPLEPSRLQRNYCMRTCGSDADCRSGYSCLDLEEGNPWGARVLEEGDRGGAKICALAYSEDEAAERASDVCTWSTPSDPRTSPPPVDAAVLPGGNDSGATLDAGRPTAIIDAAAEDAAAGDAAVIDAAVIDAAVIDAQGRDAALTVDAALTPDMGFTPDAALASDAALMSDGSERDADASPVQ
jgi:hypothetical protein